MKAINLSLGFGFLSISFAHAQTYTHPTTGIASEYVGACETATCTGTYVDNGGVVGNYNLNINNVYRVFCPNSAGNCVRLNFTQFNMEGMVDPAGPSPLDCYFDYLTIANGPTQNSTIIDQAPSSAVSTTGRICGTPAVPFTYTSTSASGCLTVRMMSDGLNTAAGFTATVSCVPCAGGPNGTDNNDCVNATALCSSANIGSNSTGPGIAAEGCTGTVCPAGGENHSNWFTFTVQTSGTLNFLITPSTGTDDYDYALFGPNVSCGSLGAPIRCSDSGSTGNTGLSAAALDVSEDVTGDKFTSTLNVTAGQTYILMIDEWTPTGAGYSLSFSGTASLDCTVLPVELVDFKAKYIPEIDAVDVYWNTLSEINNDFFTLEKSYDGVNFIEVTKVDGAGTTLKENMYFVNDKEDKIGVIYYRVKQTDFNGVFKYSRVISAIIAPELMDEVYVYPNPTNGNATVTFNSKFEENGTLTIMTSKGDIIERRPIKIVKGSDNNFTIPTSKYENGIYLIVVNTDSTTLTGKITKE